MILAKFHQLRTFLWTTRFLGVAFLLKVEKKIQSLGCRKILTNGKNNWHLTHWSYLTCKPRAVWLNFQGIKLKPSCEGNSYEGNTESLFRHVQHLAAIRLVLVCQRAVRALNMTEKTFGCALVSMLSFSKQNPKGKHAGHTRTFGRSRHDRPSSDGRFCLKISWDKKFREHDKTFPAFPCLDHWASMKLSTCKPICMQFSHTDLRLQIRFRKWLCPFSHQSNMSKPISTDLHRFPDKSVCVCAMFVQWQKRSNCSCSSSAGDSIPRPLNDLQGKLWGRCDQVHKLTTLLALSVLVQQFSKKKAKKTLSEEKKALFEEKSTFCGAFYHIFWFEIKSCFSDCSLIMAEM